MALTTRCTHNDLPPMAPGVITYCPTCNAKVISRFVPGVLSPERGGVPSNEAPAPANGPAGPPDRIPAQTWTRTETPPGVVEYERSARSGDPRCGVQNTVQIRCSAFRGTLGPTHQWEPTHTPYVQLTMALPAGREDLQAKLTEALKVFADRFIAENDLDPRKTV